MREERTEIGTITRPTVIADSGYNDCYNTHKGVREHEVTRLIVRSRHRSGYTEGTLVDGTMLEKWSGGWFGGDKIISNVYKLGKEGCGKA